ncbi:MAG: dihydroneopterin aldolase [Bacteroidetes bacterium]|nr:MAG: dihydroneopterin aldolase [Bacteroidota bacterium]
MGLIALRNMKFFGYHGCHEEEQKIGNNYVVDVFINTSLINAAKTDALSATVDYVKVHRIVEHEIAITSKLLENVAERIINSLSKEFTEIEKVKVRVAKLNPPVGGEVEQVYIEFEKKLKE